MSTNYELSPAILVQRLRVAGYSPQRVAQLMDNRLSYRALYRWSKGATPQRDSDYQALFRLAEGLGVDLAPERKGSGRPDQETIPVTSESLLAVLGDAA